MKRLEVTVLGLVLAASLATTPALAQTTDDTPAASTVDSTAAAAADSLAAAVATPTAATSSSPARTRRFAVGAYGFYEWPIAQDDAKPGAFFGGKFKYRVAPQLDVEASLSRLESGDGETDSGGAIPAPGITAYQFNASWLMGSLLQLTGGLGWASIDIESADSENKFAWNFGLGVEIPVGPLSVDISPRVLVINTADGASRKFAALMAGLNFRF